MSKQLGIGVRVYVGWAASDIIDYGVAHGRVDPRCKIATVVAGPHPAGRVSEAGGRLFRIPMRSWHVMVDGDETPFVASEILLTPIDDDQETTETDETLEAVV